MATIRITVIELKLDKKEVADAIGSGISSAMREMMAAKVSPSGKPLPKKGKAKPKAKKAKKN